MHILSHYLPSKHSLPRPQTPIQTPLSSSPSPQTVPSPTSSLSLNSYSYHLQTPPQTSSSLQRTGTTVSSSTIIPILITFNLRFQPEHYPQSKSSSSALLAALFFLSPVLPNISMTISRLTLPSFSKYCTFLARLPVPQSAIKLPSISKR